MPLNIAAIQMQGYENPKAKGGLSRGESAIWT